MTNNNTHTEHPRYTNKQGKQESENSAKTFYEIYLTTTPTPSYTQLARLSGFAERTCRNWIYQYDYRQRKQDILQQREQEKQEAIKKINQTIAPLLARIAEQHIESHQNTITDTIRRQSQLGNLPTDNHIRIQLHREDQENNKSWTQLLEGLKQTQQYDDYTRQAAQNTTVIEELLEKVEDKQLNRSHMVTTQLEEEYEDEEY